jgi:hypothetical protein
VPVKERVTLPVGTDRVKIPTLEVFVKLMLYVNGVDSFLEFSVNILLTLEYEKILRKETTHQENCNMSKQCE